MSRILPAIDSLNQHLYHLEHHPEAYCPQRCPHCGMEGVWVHGHYLRKADREGGWRLSRSGTDPPLLLPALSADLFALAELYCPAPVVPMDCSAGSDYFHLRRSFFPEVCRKMSAQSPHYQSLVAADERAFRPAQLPSA